MSASLFTSHLHDGEYVIWSAQISSARLHAARRRTRLIALAGGLAAGVIAVLLTARFLESAGGYATRDIAASLLVPLYAIFALAMAGLSYGLFSRLAVKPPAATHFAATNQRLMALGPDGALTQELAGAAIDSVIAGGSPHAPDIYVLRKGDPNDRNAFAIEHIDRPLEAKAIIEETFLKPAPAT